MPEEPAACSTIRGTRFALTPSARSPMMGRLTEDSVMAQDPVQAQLGEFAEFVKFREPLAPYTYLKLGGPADALVQPRAREELAAVVRRCSEARLPLRVLGGGCNVLVPDEGVRGVVLRLSEPAFSQVGVEGKRVRAGSGASLRSEERR